MTAEYFSNGPDVCVKNRTSVLISQVCSRAQVRISQAFAASDRATVIRLRPPDDTSWCSGAPEASREEVTLGRHAGAMFRSYTDDADDVENMSVHGMFHPTFTVPGNDGPPGNAMSSLIRATSGSRGSSATDSSVFSANLM